MINVEVLKVSDSSLMIHHSSFRQQEHLMAANASSSVLDQLRQFDTPTICNVVELFDIRPRTAGYMDQRIKACYPKLPPMVGYASRPPFRSAAAPVSGIVYAGLPDQVAPSPELPGPAVVVFPD